MAQGKKISELTEVSSVTDNDEFLFVDKEGSGADSGVGGKTAKIKFSNLKASFGNLGEQGEKGEKGDAGPRGLDGAGTQYWTQSPTDGDAIYYPTAKVAIGTDDFSPLGTSGMYIKGTVHAVLQIDGPTGNSMIGLGTPGDNTGSIAFKHIRDGNVLRISSPNASSQGGGLTLKGNSLGINADPVNDLQINPLVGGTHSGYALVANARSRYGSVITTQAHDTPLSTDTAAALWIRSSRTVDTLGESESGVRSLFRVQNNGNVGIGTDSPVEPLHIESGSDCLIKCTQLIGASTYDSSNIAFYSKENETETLMGRVGILTNLDNEAEDEALYIQAHGTGAKNNVIIRAGGASRMIVTNDGKVGIGTNLPLEELHVEGRSMVRLTKDYSAMTLAQHRLTSNAGKFGDGVDLGGFQGSLNLWSSNDDGGDGRSNKAGALKDEFVSLDFTTAYAGSSSSSSGYTCGRIGTIFEGLHHFENGETEQDRRTSIAFANTNPDGKLKEQMRITSEGNVGIGADPSIARLKVIKGGGGNDGRCLSYFQTFDADTTGSWQAVLNVSSYQNAQGEPSLQQRGVSIGTHANSNGRCGALHLNTTNASNNYYMWVDNNGQFRTSSDNTNIGNLTSTVIGDQSSDERLKVIEDNFEYGLDSVMKLKPIAFKMKDDETETRKLGFGAQTTQSIVPEAVYDSGDCIDGYDMDGENEIPRSEDTKLVMQYVQLVPVLTKAIQEQNAVIEELKANEASSQSADLLGMIETLKSEVESLKTQLKGIE